MKKTISLFLLMAYLLTLPACAVSAGSENSPEASLLQTSVISSQNLPFTDVPSGVWYEEAVRYCYENSIMSGTSGTTFSPEPAMNRAMLATVLYRMSGTPAVSDPPVFTDAVAGSWYIDAVSWAAKTGVITGYGSGTFGVNNPTTREQAVTILWRYAGSPEGSGTASVSDYDSVSSWAQTAVRWANANGILDGMLESNRFDPKTNIKRGEVASMLYHYLTGTAASQPETAGGKILAAYFSATNTTRPLAEYAADILHADLYEIVPEVPYTDADLAYYTNGRADQEQNNPSARPAISGSVENMADYDVILLGYPIWHGQPPRIISTFLESYDLAGKTIIPFCTSHSSGYSDSAIKPLAPNANWITGRRFAGGTSRSATEDWISGLELPQVTDKETNELYIQIGNIVWTVALEDNTSATAFKELLANGPLTINMSDYGGFEKVGRLGRTLPQNNRQITTKPGDVILYQGNQITIYYDENSWNFTPLGHINGVTNAELRRDLKAGGENVAVTFSLVNPKAEPVARKFDFETKTVALNSGYEMPINGLGTYSLHGDKCINSVKSALSSGVRLFDTASAYGNEEEVGQAIREAIEEGIVKREDVFVITKIYPGSEMADPEASIQACLDRLDIGYVDMMLLHHPDRNDVNAYKAMEKFVEEGKIRSIGLSNWYVEELEAFLPQVDITPALVQNEIHPYYQENDVIPYIQEKGIVVQGWYPLGGRGHTAEPLGDSVISAIAQVHGVSSAQVILRWNLQKGVVVIPGSSNPDHIRENNELYHFSLTEEEMARINALDRGEKHDWY